MGLNGSHGYLERSTAGLEGQRRAKKTSTGFSKLTCKHLDIFCYGVTSKLTDVCSDGPTPEAKSQQILALAPKLRGQPSKDRFEISPSYTQTSQKPQAAPTAVENNLIDFGPSDAPSATPHQTEQKPSHAPLLDLQEPLQPGYPVKRVDTLTEDLDEFVDAKP